MDEFNPAGLQGLDSEKPASSEVGSEESKPTLEFGGKEKTEQEIALEEARAAAERLASETQQPPPEEKKEEVKKDSDEPKSEKQVLSEQIQQILKDHNLLEGNISPHHQYWQLLTRYRSLL